ncbi:MAG: methyl-accepting chemotaxis protein, partial [Clostridia bacterium]|nr:methyl-accepting chemotaxis protein [Clostridia bacterium]
MTKPSKVSFALPKLQQKPKKDKQTNKPQGKFTLSNLTKMLRERLAFRMIAFILSIIFVLYVILAIFVVTKFYSNKYNESINIAQSHSAEASQGIENFINTAFSNSSYLQQMAIQQKIAPILTRDNIRTQLQRYLQYGSPNFAGMFVLGEARAIDVRDVSFAKTQLGDDKGRARLHTIKGVDSLGAMQVVVLPQMHSTNADETEAYQAIKNSVKAYVSHPYDVYAGDESVKVEDDKKPVTVKVVSFSLPISVHGTDFNGVVGTEVYLDALQKLIAEDSKKIGNSGLAMSDGTVLAYGQKYSYDGKKIDAILNSKDLTGSYNKALTTGLAQHFSTGGKLYCFTPFTIDNTDIKWVLWTEVPLASVLQGVTSVTLGMIVFIVCSLLVLVGAVSFIVAQQIKPIKSLTKHMENYANADFTEQIPSAILQRHDEIGKLGNSTDQMRQSVSEIVKSVRTQAKDVAEAVATVKNYIDNLHLSIETISANTQELSATLIETSGSVNAMNQSVNDFTQAVSTVSVQAEVGNKSSKEIKARAQNVFEKVRSSSEENQKIHEMTQKKLENAIKEASAIQRISSLLDTILG